MRQNDTPLPKPPGGDRPSENWICGNLQFGTPCQCGPLPNGRCPAVGLCTPANASNESGHGYQCSRAKCFGGACEMGPEPDGQCGMIPKPCMPVRSAMGRRRLYGRLVGFVGVGILLIMIGSSWRRDVFAPGALIEPHALLLGGERSNDRCAACHPAARGRFAQWFGSGQTGHASVKQSDLCMDCHHAKLDRAKATMPHNLTQDELRRAFAENLGAELHVQSISLTSSDAAMEVECALCHREHHGKDAVLTHMSNQQCQTCHTIRFESFAVGHPQWKSWPYGRGGTIAFNHSSHQYDYFAKDGTAFECRSCHQVDVKGDVARTGSFESMCASCHQQPLELKATEGFTLVGLPTLDGDAVDEADLKLGPWPNSALGIDRVEIPPLTQVLLDSDKQVAQSIKQLTDPNLTSMSEPLSQQSIRASIMVAASLRKLMDGLASNPHDEIKSRLGVDDADKVLGQLSPQLTSATVRIWFKGDAPDSTTFNQEDLPNGGWYRDDLRSAIRYRGKGHADRLLQAVCELATDSRLSPERRQLISSIGAISACLECHPNPRSGDSDSWKGIRRDAGKRLFTKFSHGPHMNLPQLVDCASCHLVNESAAASKTLVRTSGAQSPIQNGSATAMSSRIPEFKQMQKTDCMGCHTPKAAGDNCTKCHNYHIEDIVLPSTWPIRSLEAEPLSVGMLPGMRDSKQ